MAPHRQAGGEVAVVAHPGADGVGEGRADEEPPWRRCEQPGVVPWPARDTGAGRSRRRPAPAVGGWRRGGGPPGSQGDGPPLPALGRRARRGGRARPVRGRRARNRRWGWVSDRSPKGRGRSGGDPRQPVVGAAPVHRRADQAVQKDDGRSAGAQHPNGELARPGHLPRRRRPRGPTTAHGAVRVEERSSGSALLRPADPTRTTPRDWRSHTGGPRWLPPLRSTLVVSGPTPEDLSDPLAATREQGAGPPVAPTTRDTAALDRVPRFVAAATSTRWERRQRS